MLDKVRRYGALYQGRRLSRFFSIIENDDRYDDSLPPYTLHCKMSKFEMSQLSRKSAHLMSIAKWTALEKFHRKYGEEIVYVSNIEGQTCALCNRYPNGCDGCPVAEETGQSSCFDTPYYTYAECPTHENALAELEFLVDNYIGGN